MWRLGAVALAFLSAVTAQIPVSTIYWPVTTPSEADPWVMGQVNYVSWKVGGGSGVQVFDIQLHNSNSSMLKGFYPIALRVPMEKISGTSIYGGSIAVNLNTDVPIGDNYRLIFMETLSGQVYSMSPAFPILSTAPANYTQSSWPTTLPLAQISQPPNPTQQWGVTLAGINPAITTGAVNQAGNAGSGGQ